MKFDIILKENELNDMMIWSYMYVNRLLLIDIDLAWSVPRILIFIKTLQSNT
jgi:hypothetical protein